MAILLFMPEALRVKGSVLVSMVKAANMEAEACFIKSLELCRHQGALAWELRTTTDFAKVMAARGQQSEARRLLQPILRRYKEGFETPDFMSAQRLLTTLV